VCRVVGICCMTISPELCAQLEAADQSQHEQLRAAIVMEARTVPSLGELVRRDAAGVRPGELLPTPSALRLLGAAEHIPNDSRKEAIHVLASRPTR
jgi:hypothetical protein